MISIAALCEAKVPHKETYIPRVLSKSSPGTSSPDQLTVELGWRNQLHRVRLTARALTPAGAVAEWSGDGNMTEVELLGPETTHYMGHVVGRKASFAALEYLHGGFVCRIVLKIILKYG